MRVTAKIVSLLLCVSILSVYCTGLTAHAEAVAEDITNRTLISSSDKTVPINTVVDRNYSTFWTSKNPDTFVQMQAGADKTIGGLYVKWQTVPENLIFQVSSDGVSWTSIEPIRAHKYLHEYISLPQAARFVQMKAAGGVLSINELFVFSPGTPPDTVQLWNPPCEKADILFIPTHQDDEDLWFGGALALYAVQYKKNCQVAYLIQNGTLRNHEALDSVWHVGIKYYPVFSDFPDTGYSTTLEKAEKDYDSNKIIQYQVNLLRRFKPDVVVDQDVNGEYGHGAHRLNVKCLESALRLSPKPDYDPTTAKQYGEWDVPKTYLHIYPWAPIVLNYSMKLPSMGNKTPYQLAVEAFKLNKSQQNGKHAVLESGPYDCRKFGLYRTLVGFDKEKNNMLENIGNPTGPAEYADPNEMPGDTVSAPSSAPTSSAVSSSVASSEVVSSEAQASSQEPSSSQQDSSQGGAIQNLEMNSVWIIPVFVLFLLFAMTIVMIAKKAVNRRRRMEQYNMQQHKVTYVDELDENQQHDKIIQSINSDVDTLMQDMPDDESPAIENNPQKSQNPHSKDDIQ